MKLILKNIAITFLFIAFCITLSAQPLSSLPQKQRDSILLKVAQEAVNKFGPDYDRGYKTPLISNLITIEKGSFKGKTRYTVTYPYDTAKEKMEMEFSAQVLIWNDTHKAFNIMFGCNWGYNIESIEKKEKNTEYKAPVQPFVTISKEYLAHIDSLAKNAQPPGYRNTKRN